MQRSVMTLLNSLAPFLSAGIVIAITIGIFFVLSYILLWGLLFGAILYVGNSLFNMITPKVEKAEPPNSGRIIEHEEL
jgi:hypothetical protein